MTCTPDDRMVYTYTFLYMFFYSLTIVSIIIGLYYNISILIFCSLLTGLFTLGLCFWFICSDKFNRSPETTILY